ncbi:MAG: PhoU domain-containing protein [Planctomycetota bacterium]
MPNSPARQPARLINLKERLEVQGQRVRAVVDAAVEALFENSHERADWVRDQEPEIDREDVLIERDAVDLIADAVKSAETPLGPYEIRLILTIVKVNNEFERIADLAERSVSRMDSLATLPERPPPTFRVMANSVVGIMGTTCEAFAGMDPDLARLVLSSDDTTEAFRDEIVRDLERSLSRGAVTPDFAFSLNRVSAALARMTDHCSNVAEQVIYVATGKIVRHGETAWTEPEEPRL